MKKIFFLLSICIYANLQAQTTSFVYFAHNDYSLTGAAKQAIDSICKAMNEKAPAHYDILLQGFASLEGNETKNLQLSEQRVNAVKAYFIEKNTAQIEKFVVTGEGATTQFSQGKGEESYRKNRCVKITWQLFVPKQDKIMSSVEKVKPTEDIFEVPPPQAEKEIEYEDVYAKIGVPVQTFTINNERDTLLIAKNGTLIQVPAKAFAPCKEIKIELKEIYRKSEMLRERFTTMTFKQEPLKSYGMVSWSAFCGGQKVTPNEGITFFMPTDKARSTDIFYGAEYKEHFTAWKQHGNSNTQDWRGIWERRSVGVGCDCPYAFGDKLQYTFTNPKKRPDCDRWIIFKTQKQIEAICNIRLNKRFKELQKDILNSLSKETAAIILSSYYFSTTVTNSSDINCDIFVTGQRGATTLYTLYTSSVTPSSFQLVYRKETILIPLFRKEKGIYENTVMLDTDATLVEMKKEKGGDYILGTLDMKVSKNITNSKMSYARFSTDKEFVKALENMFDRKAY